MAKFRKVHTSFWDDPFIESLSAEDRYFFLFLMTNPLCTECGIYVISIKKMVSYTGYNDENVSVILKRFLSTGKILYDFSTNEICLVKKPYYIDRLGKPVIDCIKSELSKVKNRDFIEKQIPHIDKEDLRIVYQKATYR
jgi:hypothetical protein